MDNIKQKLNFLSSTGIKLTTGGMLAMVLSLLPVTQVYADRDDGDRGWRRGGDEGGWRGGEHDRWEQRGGYGNGYGGYGNYPPPAYPQAYGYAQPVYVPPPVRYLPQPSPGINLVFPLNFR